MTAITEDYVSFEIAKLLKEKGFDGECRDYYNADGQFYSEDFKSNWNHGRPGTITIFTAPTLQMVMKWLREVHKLYINIWADPKDIENDDFDTIFRAQVYNGYSNYGIYEFSTYEAACEESIKYCLENLI